MHLLDGSRRFWVQIIDDPLCLAPTTVISTVNATGTVQDGVFACKTDGRVVEATAAEFGRELDDKVRGVVVDLDSSVRASDERVVGPVGSDGVDGVSERATGDEHLQEHGLEVVPRFVGIGLEILSEGGLGEDYETSWQ